MEKVDRLGWAVGLSLKSYGVRIGVRSNDEAALQRVYEYLPSNWESLSVPVVDRVYSILMGGAGSRASVRRFSLLYGDDIRLARSSNLDEVFDRFESDLRIFVAEYARHRVFVHAGVVGWKGKAIVIPGRSYTGKSSLVAELVRAGATYYSDEYAVFDARGRVHPYSKPLELRETGKFKQSRYDITHFGGTAGTKPLPVGLVVMTKFREGASWRPRKLSPGKGVLEMLNNTVSARRDPERALSTLEVVASQADVLKGIRGQASEMVPALLRRIEKTRMSR
ncbi:MAG: hypothetical protein M3539_18525 [Acidobacteriota bacterium]|nr:hypothetical protein [Acidobacteriota bacterium]